MAKTEAPPLPRSIWILFAGVFVNRFGSFVTVFLILYMIHKGFTPVQAGMATSAYGIGSIGAAGFGGYLADRLGRRGTIMLSMFASAAAMLLLSQAPTLPLIVLITGLAGLVTELYRPASSALLADLVPPEQRVRAFALYRLSVNLGFAAGPATAGFLANHSFFLLFLGDALTSMVFGFLALFALPRGTQRQAGQERSEIGMLKAVRGDYRFLSFLVASIATAFVYFQSQSTFALQVQSNGLSSAVYGALISFNGLVIVFLELPISTVTQRLPTRPVIATGLFLIGAGFGLTALAHNLPLLAVTVAIWTLGEMIHSPVSAAYVANLAPVHLRGRYQGAYGLTWSAGLILGPLLGTMLFSWNHALLWGVCGPLGIVAATLVMAGRSRPAIPEQGGPGNPMKQRGGSETLSPERASSENN